jgi:predicted nucleotidyltransferase
MAVFQPREVVRVLLEAGVDFVVVGGLAAIAHGASYVTRDFDAVAPLTEENCARILKALGPYAPRFYQAHGKPPVARTAAQLSEFRNLYLETSLGIVDLLGSLPPVGDFFTVAARAVPMQLEGRACRVLSLDDLIAVKAFVGRPKDKAVEMELRAIRERLAR